MEIKNINIVFANIKQATKQSIRKYGDTLKRSALIVFSTMSPKMIESHLDSAFSKGLIDDELRAYAKKKFYKPKIKMTTSHSSSSWTMFKSKRLQ